MRCKWIGAALFLPALSVICLPISAATPFGCQMVKIASLPIEVTTTNRVVVSGSIKGEPAKFLLDTGASWSLSDNAVISHFGVASGIAQAHMYGLGGEFEAYKATIPDLVVGNLKGGNLMMWVSSTHFLQEGIYGVLGEDFFKNADLDIDLAHGKFDLFEHYDCKTEPVYWADKFSEADVIVRNEAGAIPANRPGAIDRNVKIFVTVEVNGISARAILDLGAPYTIVSWSLARRLGLEKASQGMELIGKVSGFDRNKMDLFRYRFAEFGIGDEVIRNPLLFVSDLQQRKKDGNSMDHIQDKTWSEGDILLGTDFIRSHHMFVAADQGKIYFTWNGGSIFLPPKE